MEFQTIEGAQKTDYFKTKNFARIYKCMLSNKIILEVSDLGPCLTHHKLLHLGDNYKKY